MGSELLEDAKDNSRVPATRVANDPAEEKQKTAKVFAKHGLINPESSAELADLALNAGYWLLTLALCFTYVLRGIRFLLAPPAK